MREFRTYGSVRGAHGNGRPYRNLRWSWVGSNFGCPRPLFSLISNLVMSRKSKFPSRSIFFRLDFRSHGHVRDQTLLACQLRLIRAVVPARCSAIESSVSLRTLGLIYTQAR